MRLRDLLSAHNIVAQAYGKYGCRLVFAADVPDRADLYRLEDYYVSSAVSGPAYVLCPRDIW